MHNIEIIQNIVRDVFNDDSITINEGQNISDIKGWDSFNHISLMAAVQDEFSTNFTTEDISAIRTFNDILKIIEKNAPH